MQRFLSAMWPSTVSVTAKVFLRIFERAFCVWWNNSVSLSLDLKLTTEFRLFLGTEIEGSRGASSHCLLEHFQRKRVRGDVRHLTGWREQTEKGEQMTTSLSQDHNPFVLSQCLTRGKHPMALTGNESHNDTLNWNLCLLTWWSRGKHTTLLRDELMYWA